jgi:hypothetical protein
MQAAYPAYPVFHSGEGFEADSENSTLTGETECLQPTGTKNQKGIL